jgi:hypothetical protein
LLDAGAPVAAALEASIAQQSTKLLVGGSWRISSRSTEISTYAKAIICFCAVESFTRFGRSEESFEVGSPPAPLIGDNKQEFTRPGQETGPRPDS